jgi:uncharacterized protein (DUF1697 family)/very-short-patch-repair endonuclease
VLNLLIVNFLSLQNHNTQVFLIPNNLMTKYIALLRGINVGGNSKVEMKKLKVTFEKLGFGEVTTYINSGNVLFECAEQPILSSIEKAIKKDFGFEVKVLVWSQENISLLCNAIPEFWENNSEMKTDVLFLWDDMDKPETSNLIPQNPEVDTLIYHPGAIIWHIKKADYNKSGMHKFVGTRVYKSMTARNVNTVRRLEEMIKKFPSLRGGSKADGVDKVPFWAQKSLFSYWTLPKNETLVSLARKLKKAGVLSEVIFWQSFKSKDILGWDIDRQVIIGNYIVDFFIPELGLVVEIDGSSHDNKGGSDVERESYLRSLNLEVLHYTDLEVKKSFDFVSDSFQVAIKKRVVELSSTLSLRATPQEGNSD